MIGDHLQHRHRFRPLSFAAPLKRLCSETFHLPPENFELQVTKEIKDPGLKVSPRQIMQAVGTGLFRNELPKLLPDLDLGEDCPSIWIYSMKKELEKDEKSDIVVTDVRFSDEIDFIAEQGGKIVYVDRFDDAQWCLDQHESEGAFRLRDQCDVVIDNTKSVAYCLEQVDAFLDQM